MAKVKSPLLSLSASGQIAKSLVFSSWKGIADVRQYVIPANPKSDDQKTQRGFLKSAVDLWHAVTRNAADAVAFNIAAALESKPMSGFNYFCKSVIAALKADYAALVPYTFTTPVNADGTIDISVFIDGNIACSYQIGTKPTVLGEPVALTHAAEINPYTAEIVDLTVGVDYFIKFSTVVVENAVVSGIYKVRALAAE